MTTDDFKLQLAVGIKDLYSQGAEQVQRASDDLLEHHERLKQSLDDVGAFEQSDAALLKLTEKQKKLQKQYDEGEDQQQKLLAQRKALIEKQKAGLKLTASEEQQLKQLNAQIKRSGEAQNDLRAELDHVTRQAREQERAFDRLGTSLKKAGVDTRQLRQEQQRLEKELEQTRADASDASRWESARNVASGGILAGAAGLGGFLSGNIVEWDRSIRHLAAGIDEPVSRVKAWEQPMRAAVSRLNGATTPEGFTTTMRAMRQQMRLTGQAAIDASEEVHQLFSVHPEQAPDEIIRAATQAQIAWGTETAQSTDLFNKILNQSGDRANDLLDTFWEYGPTIARAGLDVEQFSAMLVRGAQEGVWNYDVIGDIMKEGYMARITDVDAWNKLVGDGKKPGEIDTLLADQPEQVRVLKETLMRLRHGLKAQNEEQTSRAWAGLMTQFAALKHKDPQQARNLIEAVFGTRGAEEVTSGAMAGMAKAITDPQAILGEYEGSLQQAFDRQQTWLDQMYGAGSRFFNALAQPVQRFIEMLAPVGEQMVQLTHAITDWVEATPGLAEAIVGLTLAIGALKAVILAKKGINLLRGVDPDAMPTKKKPGLAKKLATGAGNHLKTGAAAAAGAVAVAGKSLATRTAASLGPMLARGAGMVALGSTPLGWAITGLGTAAWMGYEYWPQISGTLQDLFKETKEQKKPPEQPAATPVQIGQITFSPQVAIKADPATTSTDLRQQMITLMREQQTEFVLEMRNLLEAVQDQQDQALYAR